MDRVFNRKDQKEIRRALRHEPTKAESYLWQRLRDGRLGQRFRRQYSVGDFVLDFYCPSAHLAVEVDGWSHEGASAEIKDQARQSFVEGYGIRFLHFLNDLVLNDIEAVVEEIVRVMGERE